MTAPGVLRVALDMPLGRLFDYLPPAPLAADFAIEPGVRVGVPFGRQRLVGVVMESARCSEVPAERLKAVLQVLDPIPVFDRSALELLRWAAEYYHHPIGQVLAAALPKALRLGAGVRANEERWIATAQGREALARGDPRRAPKQRELLAHLVEHDGALADALSERMAGWRDAARSLAARGWIASTETPVKAPLKTALKETKALPASAPPRFVKGKLSSVDCSSAPGAILTLTAGARTLVRWLTRSG